MTRTKIGTEYYQSGYGRGPKQANIWLIDGFAYAKDAAGAATFSATGVYKPDQAFGSCLSQSGAEFGGYALVTFNLL